MSRKPISIAIVGAGGLARAMARALARSGGAVVTVAARRAAMATSVARGVRGISATTRIDEAAAAADVVLLAVPDRAIAPLAAKLAPARASWRGIVVLHAAGAYGPEPLAPLRKRGAATGVWHPLAVLGGSGSVTLAGAAARIEGAPSATAAARRLSALVGIVPLRAGGLRTPQGRRSYHAAASLASNDLIALLAIGQSLLVRRGVPQAAALRALVALAQGTLTQVRRSGLYGALTGPVARNDGATVAAQLRALRALDPEAGEAHRALSLRLVAVAQAQGRLDAAAARGLRALLSRGRGRSSTV
jgi:predicted short-subunit dehydrogenase-like oxidoreductase (DUF2520 family)